LVVIESSWIKAEDIVGDSNEFFFNVEQGNEFGAARLILGLKNESESRVLDTLKLGVLDSEHGREGEVSIVGTTSTLEIFSADDGLGGGKALSLVLHQGLLIKMTVIQELLVWGSLGFLDNVDDERVHAFGLENIFGQTLNFKFVDVVGNASHGLFVVTVGEVFGVDVGVRLGMQMKSERPATHH
jgi:hypothetical protein